MSPDRVLKFWFEECSPKDWWKKSREFDELIESRFGELHEQASKGELFSWRVDARGRLAEIIVLDQFSRNIYRDQREAFAQDGMALVLAQEAENLGCSSQLSSNQQRVFMYMPYMHSESPVIHQEAEQLFRELGEQGNLDFELKHKAIIDRFGRYPHRNQILGRSSTEEEKAFLTQPGSGF